MFCAINEFIFWKSCRRKGQTMFKYLLINSPTAKELKYEWMTQHGKNQTDWPCQLGCKRKPFIDYWFHFSFPFFVWSFLSIYERCATCRFISYRISNHLRRWRWSKYADYYFMHKKISLHYSFFLCSHLLQLHRQARKRERERENILLWTIRRIKMEMILPTLCRCWFSLP